RAMQESTRYYCDRATVGRGILTFPLNRVVKVGNLDHNYASDLFFRLGIRPVLNLGRAPTNAQRRGEDRGLEYFSADKHPGLFERSSICSAGLHSGLNRLWS